VATISGALSVLRTRPATVKQADRSHHPVGHWIELDDQLDHLAGQSARGSTRYAGVCRIRVIAQE
jgi:hypothetical protein